MVAVRPTCSSAAYTVDDNWKVTPLGFLQSALDLGRKVQIDVGQEVSVADDDLSAIETATIVRAPSRRGIGRHDGLRQGAPRQKAQELQCEFPPACPRTVALVPRQIDGTHIEAAIERTKRIFKALAEQAVAKIMAEFDVK